MGKVICVIVVGIILLIASRLSAPAAMLIGVICGFMVARLSKKTDAQMKRWRIIQRSSFLELISRYGDRIALPLGSRFVIYPDGLIEVLEAISPAVLEERFGPAVGFNK